MLAGMKPLAILFYALSLNGLYFIVYLIFYYLRRQKFYDRLTTPIRESEEALQSLDDVDIAHQLTKLLRSHYTTYETKLAELFAFQEEQFIFNDRWVHQMKTPLAVLELMASDLDEPASTQFREEIDRLKTGLDMALHMARVRTMEQDFHIEQVSLKTIVQEVNKSEKRFFIQHHIFPEVVERKEDVVVETDAKWLEFILSQLVHNAVK